MELCPCGTNLLYHQCCEVFISEKSFPLTVEQLMRSRYSAYVYKNLDYIISTTYPKQRENVDWEAIRSWSENSDWHKLEIVNIEKGNVGDQHGTVEFIAHYSLDGKQHAHHEKSSFKKEGNTWFFEVKQQKRPTKTKTGRNSPCPCGSGKKYKKCCML